MARVGIKFVREYIFKGKKHYDVTFYSRKVDSYCPDEGKHLPEYVWMFINSVPKEFVFSGRFVQNEYIYKA